MRERSVTALVGATLAAVFAFIALQRWTEPVPLHLDTIRDFLLARDCLTMPSCETLGAKTSFAELTQGGLWIRVIAFALDLGWGPDRLATFMRALMALSVGVIFYTGHRFFGAITAVVAALIAGFGLARLVPAEMLWNPSLMPLPLAVLMLALFELNRSGHLGWAIAAGVALEMAVEGHVIALVLAPVAVLAAALAPRRPAVAVSLLLVSMRSLAWEISQEALSSNLAAFGALLSMKLVGLLVAAVVATMLARKWWLTRPERVRTAMPILLSLAVFYAGSALIPRNHAIPFEPRYALPLVPVLALLPGLLLQFIPNRLPVWTSIALVVVCGGIVLAKVHAHDDQRTPVMPAHYTFEEALKLDRALHDRYGMTYSQFARALRGPDAELLLSTYGLVASLQEKDSNRAPRTVQQIRSRKATRSSSLLKGWDVVPLSADVEALVTSQPSWVSTETFQVCYETNEGKDRKCVIIGDKEWDEATRTPARYAMLAYPRLQAVAELRDEWTQTHAEGFITSYELPYRIERPAGNTVEFVKSMRAVVVPFRTGGPNQWGVEVPGATFEDQPSKGVKALLGTNPFGGDVRFSRPAVPWNAASEFWIPDFIELPMGQAELLPVKW